MRQTLKALITSGRWEAAIIAIIVVNAITLGLETSPTVMGSIGPLLQTLDKIILGLFVAELILRLYVHRLSFFRDPWSIFDFLIVAIALVPASGPLRCCVRCASCACCALFRWFPRCGGSLAD